VLYIHRHAKNCFGGRLVIVCYLLLALYSSGSGAEETAVCRQDKPLVFGFLPLLSVEQLVARFSPLVNYLSEHLGVPVQLETAPNFVEFARRTHEDRRYDILYTAPHLYTQANRKAGYQLIASVDSPGMWAVIVAPRQSDIQTIQDLRGRRLATVHPFSLAAILIRKSLADAGIDPDVDLELVITPSHDASLLSSYHGVTEASGLMQPPYEAASEEVKRGMRVIARSEITPHIPISVGPWIPEPCAEKITAVLMKMSDTPEGESVLQHIHFTGFRNPDPRDYERLNELLYQ
jgi:phosphonate transport system substrate-binding protein